MKSSPNRDVRVVGNFTQRKWEVSAYLMIMSYLLNYQFDLLGLNQNALFNEPSLLLCKCVNAAQQHVQISCRSIVFYFYILSTSESK